MKVYASPGILRIVIKRCCSGLLVFLAAVPLVLQAQLVTRPASAGLVIKTGWKGAPAQALSWDDVLGTHLLVLIGNTSDPGNKEQDSVESNQARLRAGHFIDKGDSLLRVWTMQDGVQDCEFDLTAEFIPAATQVTDLDQDSIAETWVMYRLACRSDVSPATLKLLMYEGDSKYAMRGTSRVQVSASGFMGGNGTMDVNLKAAPAFFQNRAALLWKQYRNERWD